MEVEDVASTDTMVGAEGANVCVMAGNYNYMMGKLDQVFVAEKLSQYFVVICGYKRYTQNIATLQHALSILFTFF